MTIQSPKIDKRNQRLLAEQVRERLLENCPEWKDMASLKSDKFTESLIQIFSRMMETTIDRLNRVPDKNFLSFLDMADIRLRPPRVAGVPLVFTMAEGSKQYGFIPAGAQVAGETGDKKEIIFETGKDLTVILPKPVKAFSLDPGNDYYKDHSTNFFTNEQKKEDIILKGESLLPHRLYLGHNEMFSLKEPVTIVLKMSMKKLIPLQEWGVRWYCYDEESGIKHLSASSEIDNNILNITLQNVSGVSEKTLKGFEKGTGKQNSWTNYWVFAELDMPVSECRLPEIDTITASVSIENLSLQGTGTITAEGVDITGAGTLFTRELRDGYLIEAENQTGIIVDVIDDTSLKVVSDFDTFSSKEFSFISFQNPDLLFFNNFSLDITKDFHPFGEKPKFNDTFYVASEEVFAKEGAAITITVVLTENLEPDTQDIKLRWEFYDGDIWRLIANSSRAGVPGANGPYEFKDLTNAFTTAGKVEFKCPAISKNTINGEENHWVRVRITGGNYGEEAKYREQTVTGQDEIVVKGGVRYKLTSPGAEVVLGGAEDTEWVYVPPTFRPPSISSFKVNYSYSPPEEELQAVLSYNDFLYQDRLSESGNPSDYFAPFEAVKDDDPALYIAFDNDISSLPITMYFPLAANLFAPHMTSENQSPPIIAWEYWNGNKWSGLSLEDKTINLTKSEIVQFLVPDDIEKKPCFEEERYWVRARLDKGNYSFLPRLNTIYTNAVRGYNMITIQEEVLGSGNGKPGQTLKFSQSPVLPGQKVIVRETALTEAEREKILSEEGVDAIMEVRDDADNIKEIWVRWHEVTNYYFSEPDSRHYVLDRINGTITFGDGVKGMIPPAGKDNIKCGGYQYGGGSSGNVKSNIITKLKTTFPYIDSVKNPAAAEGGFDQEDLDNLRVRGPQTIKHRDRAVTYEDFEWLVRESSPKVAKVKCLPVTNMNLKFSPGWITIIVVPESDDPKPLPSEELLNNIENYLYARTSTHLTLYPAQINLRGPDYIRMGVNASVKLTSVSKAKIIEGQIIDNLNNFFHPLRGGPEKKGWEFGRNVYISEVYEVIEKTEGVDYVEYLTLNASVQIYQLSLTKTSMLSYSFPRYSAVKSLDGRVVFSLAQDIQVNMEISSLSIAGFKEGDPIVLSYGADSIELIVNFVSHDLLECAPYKTKTIGATFPAGSKVETADGTLRSFIFNEVSAGVETCTLKVSVFESGDRFTIIQKDELKSTSTLEVFSVDEKIETVFIEDNFLVYPGSCSINRKKNDEDPFRYLLNLNTLEVHDLQNRAGNCMIDRMLKDNMRYLKAIDRSFVQKMKIDYCRWCFGPEMSKR